MTAKNAIEAILAAGDHAWWYVYSKHRYRFHYRFVHGIADEMNFIRCMVYIQNGLLEEDPRLVLFSQHMTVSLDAEPLLEKAKEELDMLILRDIGVQGLFKVYDDAIRLHREEAFGINTQQDVQYFETTQEILDKKYGGRETSHLIQVHLNRQAYLDHKRNLDLLTD